MKRLAVLAMLAACGGKAATWTPTPSPFGKVSVERMFVWASTCSVPLHPDFAEFRDPQWVFSCEESHSPDVGWRLTAYHDGRIDKVTVFERTERALRPRVRALIPTLVPATDYARFDASLFAEHGDLMPDPLCEYIRVSHSSPRTSAWISWNAHVGL